MLEAGPFILSEVAAELGLCDVRYLVSARGLHGVRIVDGEDEPFRRILLQSLRGTSEIDRHVVCNAVVVADIANAIDPVCKTRVVRRESVVGQVALGNHDRIEEGAVCTVSEHRIWNLVVRVAKEAERPVDLRVVHPRLACCPEDWLCSTCAVSVGSVVLHLTQGRVVQNATVLVPE